MKAVRFTGKSTPIVFAIITLAAYGLLLPLTGFYWDDWPFAWIAKFRGPADFIPAFQGFRPFLGPIFSVTTSLLPPDPRLWQVVALLTRYLAGVCAWFMLDKVWPRQRKQTLIAALLFLVFPGYSQHWVAFTHVNQEWISLICYMLSIGLSIQAIRRPQRYAVRTGAALLLMFVGLFPTEYFVGLEPIRLLFIWVVIGESTSGFGGRLRESLRRWWPFALLWLADLVWLLSYYKSGTYVSYGLTAARTIPPVGETLLALGDALWKACAFVWVQVLVLMARAPGAPTSLLTLGLIAAALIAASFYLLKLDLHPQDASNETDTGPASVSERAVWHGLGFSKAAIPIGLIAVLLGRVPSFAAGLPLTLQSSFDRFMISMMLGACLLLSGLIEFCIRDEKARAYVAAGLLALAVGQQFYNANIFRRDWQRQQEIYWQLAWRIPALRPGTAILTQQMPLDYETDLSMTAALNWIYSPLPRPTALPYALLYTEKRLGGTALPNLNANTSIQLPFRTVSFEGNTSQVIVVYVPPSGCLRVLDPLLNDMQTYSRFPDSVTAPIPLSKPDLIVTAAAPRTLPSPPFTREPPHEWCYFYEKAELARQTGNWHDIIQLNAAATQRGLVPMDALEWLPFLEANARVGDLAYAERTSRMLWETDPGVHRGLCVLWRRLRLDGQVAARASADQLIREFSCTP